MAVSQLDRIRELHRPHWLVDPGVDQGRWLACLGCDEGAHADADPGWPCRTAEIAYSASEIKAAKKGNAVVTETCAHCGQTCGDYDGGYAATTTPGGTFIALCHPNAPGRPDCYRRVTVYRETLGALTDVENKPVGVDGAPFSGGIICWRE